MVAAGRERGRTEPGYPAPSGPGVAPVERPDTTPGTAPPPARTPAPPAPTAPQPDDGWVDELFAVDDATRVDQRPPDAAEARLAPPTTPAAPTAAPVRRARHDEQPSGGRRRRSAQSITDALAAITTADDDDAPATEAATPAAEPAAPAPAARPAPSESDTREVRKLFEDLAALHVAQVRNVMLELRHGEAACSWIESSKPALRSLRSMAEPMDLTELCTALDTFCAAVDEALAAGNASVTGAERSLLLDTYERLIELIPQAFELDAEHDRREPVIVESLLKQVRGVEKLTIDKLFGAGMGRLDALLAANAKDMADTSGIPLELAERIVEHLRWYRTHVTATVSAPDVDAEFRALADLLDELRALDRDFEAAAAGWTADHKKRKKELRKERDQAFLRIKVALARLGETERLRDLERLPFARRIDALDDYLRQQRQAARARPAAPPRPSPIPGARAHTTTSAES